MKRWEPVLVGALALALTACQKKQAPQARVEEPGPSLAQLDTAPPPRDPYATDPYANDPLVAPRPWATDDVVVAAQPTAPGGQRTHVVVKGDTLYKLARQYYNDQGGWKKIWEANRAQVPDPNKLPVGARLVIP